MHAGTNRLDCLAEEARAVFERAAVAAGTGPGAEQLVPEIAVARLHVDEGETGIVRQPCRPHEDVDEPIEVLVGQETDAAGKSAIEQRVRRARFRLGAIVRIRPGVAA